MNKHEFQNTAKKFRAGRISLTEFADAVYANDDSANDESSKPNESRESTSGTQIRPDSKLDAKLDAKGLPQLRIRPIQAHKGDFGRVVLIGGSAGMSGAISLSGLAALKSGSGLVKVAVPSEIQSIVAAYSPCYMTVGCLSENGEFHGAALDSLERESDWSDVIGLGPGMERGAAQRWIVPKLYAESQSPMVIDADGLNTLCDAETNLAEHNGQRILTPHPGEFQRLIRSQLTDRKQLEDRAIELAKAANLVVVLKGNRTLVTDGESTFYNQTGNPGMATAGSGDVLTGVITSLVGQGLPLFDAAVLGVHIHGLAGDLAASSVGETSLTATDIIHELPSAFKKHAFDAKERIGF